MTIFKLPYFHNYLLQQNNPWYSTSTNLQLMPLCARSFLTSLDTSLRISAIFWTNHRYQKYRELWSI